MNMSIQYPLAALMLVAGVASAQPNSAAIVAPTNLPPSHIVVCREGVDVYALTKELGIIPRNIYRYAFNGFAASLNPASVTALSSDGRILMVETNGQVSLCEQTNSTGLVRMGFDRFPISRINGANEPINVDVAVLDTGMDLNHEDLNVYQSFSTFTDYGEDWNGHGTSVAGVIGALDNGKGVVGAAPGVRLWNVQVLGPPPNNGWNNVLEGAEYIVEHSNQISVVNCSFGPATLPNNGSAAVLYAVRSMVSAGIVVVAGAGNNTNDLAGPDGVYGTFGWGMSDDFFPASFPESMAVSAMDPSTDTRAVFSNFSAAPRTNNFVISPGGAIDVAAPGVGIASTFTNNSYGVFNGTSIAAPHVTGLVALYIAANGRATNAAGVYRIRQAIIDASLPQSQWRTNNTGDPDSNPDPLAVVSEEWIPAPKIISHAKTEVGFQVRFLVVPGYNYAVQWSTNLAAGAWEELDSFTVSGNAMRATVNDSLVSTANRFYRLLRSAPSAVVVSPSIQSIKPGRQVVLAGTNVSFLALVNGSWPLSYQWLRDGLIVPAQTNALLTLTNVQPADGGYYSLQVRNGAAMAISSEVELVVHPCVAPMPGLVSWWTAEGNALDSVGTNHGAAEGNLEFDPGKVGTGFQTSSGWVAIPDSPELRPTNVTVAAWVSAVSPGDYRYILSKSYSTASGGSYAMHSGPGTGLAFYVIIVNVGYIYAPFYTGSIWDGQFHHVAGTYDGQTVRLFVDGAQVGNGTHATGELAYDTSFMGGQLILGNFNTNAPSVCAFPGTIDDVAIYNRALSADEIGFLYSVGVVPMCPTNSVIALPQSAPGQDWETDWCTPTESNTASQPSNAWRQ